MGVGSKTCPNCGTELIPEAKFCRICGTKVTKATSHSTTLMPDEHVKPPEMDFSLNDDLLKQLSARQRIKEIDKDMNEILQQVEVLVNKSKAGLIGKDEAKTKIDAAKQKISSLKSEKKELEILAKKKLTVEELHEKFKEASDKLRKLNDMKRAGTIKHPEVHAEMVRKYQAELSQVRQDLDRQRQQLQYWMASLREDLNQKDKEIERIRIQAELGEITKSEATERENEIISTNKTKMHALKTLEEIYDYTTP